MRRVEQDMVRKQAVDSALKRYNANSRNNNQGDCVARSLSLAYGLDYDETKSSLVKYAHNIGKRWNTYACFSNWMLHKGYKKLIWLSEETAITAEQLSNIVQDGIVVALVGQKFGEMSHMLTIIDGDIYDSWDSRKKIVDRYFIIDGDVDKLTVNSETINELSQSKPSTTEVPDTDNQNSDTKLEQKDNSAKQSKSRLNEAPSIYDIKDEVLDSIYKYVDKLDKNREWMNVYIEGGCTVVDDYTCYVRVTIEFLDIDKTFDSPALSVWANAKSGYNAVVKVNPRMSAEANISANTKKLHDRIREFVYQYRKEVEDCAAFAKSTTPEGFTGSKTLWLKLPEWVRPITTFAIDNGTQNGYCDRYEVRFKALDGDDRKNSYPVVYAYGDTIPELRKQLGLYKDRYMRYNFDY